MAVRLKLMVRPGPPWRGPDRSIWSMNAGDRLQGLNRLPDARRHAAEGSFSDGRPRRLWLAVNKRHAIWWLLRSWRRLAPAAGRLLRPAASSAVRGAAPNREIPGASAPAFDLRICNPIHWPRRAGAEAVALGPLAALPSGSRADWTIRSRNPFRLRCCHHLEDAQAFHADPIARAGALVRLAAVGAVVHVADADARLRALLGHELHRLMAAEASNLDAGERELRSIGLRRAALRDHSSWARDRAKLPLVSMLLATRRPALLPQALAAAAGQTYPRLELVLALHGNERAFPSVEQRISSLPLPVKVARLSSSAPLGALLNAAVAASTGELLTKMDDDDWYGTDHVWDLVLARQYSGAKLVGKGTEFVYLAASNQTLHCFSGRGEAWRASCLAGGALLIARPDLDRIGGWRNAPLGVDLALLNDVLRSGGSVYRTHGAGFMMVRQGQGHTWSASDDYFRAKADRIIPGCAPGAAGLERPPAPPPPAASCPP